MIKLINYQKYVSREVFISKTMIHSMERGDDMTHIIMEGGCSYTVKETPEEILAMPDIEETNKVIDWEQRRYEIAKIILSKIPHGELKVSAQSVVRFTNVLIEGLKKGDKNE